MKIIMCIIMQYRLIFMYTVGEFGIVYKGYIVKDQGSIVTEPVAVKTLKGIYFDVYISRPTHLWASNFITFLTDNRTV